MKIKMARQTHMADTISSREKYAVLDCMTKHIILKDLVFIAYKYLPARFINMLVNPFE